MPAEPAQLAPITAFQEIPQESSDGFVPRMSSLSDIFEGFERQRDMLFANKPGAMAGERSMWGPASIKVTSPFDFPMITSLNNDDPNSFWYTWRPNIFNIQVEDEWDWSNLINTDRSDFTDTPYTVGTDISYLENGFTYAKVNDPGGHYSIRTLPESLYRYGISDNFELRLKWVGYNMVNDKDPTTGQVASSFGTNDIDPGFKWQMFPQANWFPRTTIVAGALLPTGTTGFSGNSVQPHFNFIQGWGVRRYIFLKHQFGMDYLTQPNFNVSGTLNGPMGPTGAFLNITHPTVDSFHSSVSCLYQATKTLGGFVEWYVVYGNFATTNYMDTGLFYYLTPNIQLDAVIGSSVESANGNLIFTKCGFSTRW